VTVEQIISTVALFYEFSDEELRGSRRTKDVALARQVAMYLAREGTDSPLSRIGSALGGRDHTTVMHGHDKIALQIEEDDQLRRDVLAIRGMLYQSSSA
jgi:chromosomal replication initiator protein